jgi:hypothetical protein
MVTNDRVAAVAETRGRFPEDLIGCAFVHPSYEPPAPVPPETGLLLALHPSRFAVRALQTIDEPGVAISVPTSYLAPRLQLKARKCDPEGSLSLQAHIVPRLQCRHTARASTRRPRANFALRTPKPLEKVPADAKEVTFFFPDRKLLADENQEQYVREGSLYETRCPS